MSTNRENINKLSNKELSVLLRYQCYIGQDGKIKTIPVEGIAGAPVEDTIAKYLNKKYDSTYLSEISDWLSLEDVDNKDKTADELFKELGYELDKDNTRSKRTIAVYKDKDHDKIIEIDFNYKEYENKDYEYVKHGANMFAEYITEEETKAIMKKIEEHKNDKNDWLNKAVEDYKINERHMLTNRDNINKMSNEELAATIMAKVSTMPRFSNISGFTDAGKELAKWLSQEAKETISGNIVYVSPHEIKKIELTEQEYKDILERLDKLENKTKNKINVQYRLEPLKLLFIQESDGILFTYNNINDYFGKEKYYHYMLLDDNQKRLFEKWHPIIGINKIPLNSKYIQFMDDIGETSSIYPIKISNSILSLLNM